MTTTCPCCGQEAGTDETFLVSLDASAVARGKTILRLQPQETVIVYKLREIMPRTMSPDQLMSALYGWREPVSKDPKRSLRVQISRIRRTLKPIGVSIENMPCRGYRLTIK
jgi:DNA-binding response OmpR family regulator